MEPLISLILVTQENTPEWDALLDVLNRESRFRIVGTVNSTWEAHEFIRENLPDVVLMGMGGNLSEGVELTRWIDSFHPEVRKVICIPDDDQDVVLVALTSGAEGFCSMETSPTNVVQIIKSVREGQTCLDPIIARHIRDFFSKIY